jgi:hypothetical protein
MMNSIAFGAKWDFLAFHERRSHRIWAGTGFLLPCLSLDLGGEYRSIKRWFTR